MRGVYRVCVGVSFFSSIVLSGISAAQETLTDYQRFISYPYIEKAYRLQSQGEVSKALVEANKALEYAPEYSPYRELALQLTMQSMELFPALEMIARYDVKSTMLAEWVELVISLEDTQQQMTLALRLIQKSEFTAAQKSNFATKLIERFIGLKAFDEAIFLFEEMIKFDTPSRKLVERIMLVFEAVDEPKKAIQHFIKYQENTTESMEVAFVELVLRSNVPNKFDIFNGLLNQSAAQKGMKAWTQQQVGKGEANKALKGFRWLEDNNGLSQYELGQYILMLAESNELRALTLLADSDMNCRAKIEVQLQLDALEHASKTLRQCLSQGKYFVGWQQYASQLLSIRQLRSLMAFGGAQSIESQKSLKLLVLNKDIASRNYQSLIEGISADSRDPIELNTLLASYEALKKWQDASEVAIRLYQIQPTADNLDRLTFVLTQAEQRDKAKIMLVQLFTANQPLNLNSQKRLISLLTADDLAVNAKLMQKFADWRGADSLRGPVAELLRLADNCAAATELLIEKNSFNYAELMTQAMCFESLDQFEKASALYEQAHLLLPSRQIHDARINLAIKQGDMVKATSLLEAIPPKQRDLKWYQQLVQLHYQSGDFDKVVQLLSSKIEDFVGLSEEMYDVYIESLIAIDDYEHALEISIEQFNAQTSFTTSQWWRLGNIYDELGNKPEAIRAYRAALTTNPENNDLRLSLAFALIDEQPEEALRQFQIVEAADEEFDPVNYEQMAFLSNSVDEQALAANYLKYRFSQYNKPYVERTNHYWGLRRFYGDLTQTFRFTATASFGTGAILGDVFFNESGSASEDLPSNNLTIRAEYFFDTLNSGTTAYAQVSGNGSNDNIFADVSHELGLTYRPFDSVNFRVSTGFQRFLNAGFSWEGFVRLNGDTLNQNQFRQDWRAESGWWERNLYYDYMYFYESSQVFGQVLFNYGYASNISDTAFQTLLVYGLGRYDYRRALVEVDGQSAFDELAVGLGVRLEHYFVDRQIEDRLDNFSLSLEWRVNLAGELSEDTHGLFFVAGYEF